MMICPIDEDSFKTIKISDYDPQWLISDLVGGHRTGCLKLSNDIEKLRGAMVFLKGSVVGAIYVSKACIETKPTEESLDLCLKSLKQSDTTVMLYDLPEELVLSFSSLFLGYPVSRMDSYTSIDYYHYITDWCQKEQSTLTIALLFEDGGGICFGFVYSGRYIGAFHVEEQEFSDDQEFLIHLMDLYPHSTLGVSILPPEMTSSVVRFGFDLDQAWKHLEGK